MAYIDHESEYRALYSPFEEVKHEVAATKVWVTDSRGMPVEVDLTEIVSKEVRRVLLEVVKTIHD